MYHRASQVMPVVKNLPANAGDIRDTGSVCGSERSPREGHDSSLQYSCLETPMNRGAWQTTVQWVTKSWTQPRSLACTHHNLFIHSSVDGHLGCFFFFFFFYLGCFYALAVVNSAAMKVGLHVSFWIVVSSGYMPRSETVGSYGSFFPSIFKKSPYCSP